MLIVQLLKLLDQTAAVTAADLQSGKTIDILVRNTVEEIGEYCAALSVEQGYKRKVLTESSMVEAVDTVICALSLFYGVGGTHEELVAIMERKLPKWEQRVRGDLTPNKEPETTEGQEP